MLILDDFEKAKINITYSEIEEILLEYEDYINKDNFIGWPSARRIGGYHMGMKLEKPDGSADERYSIGKYDPHPNKLGHEKIAKEIHESF